MSLKWLPRVSEKDNTEVTMIIRSRNRCAPCGIDAREDVRDVLADLIGGFQAEEAEIAEQVVVRGQELQVQLWQRQTCLACTPPCVKSDEVR